MSVLEWKSFVRLKSKLTSLIYVCLYTYVYYIYKSMQYFQRLHFFNYFLSVLLGMYVYAFVCTFIYTYVCGAWFLTLCKSTWCLLAGANLMSINNQFSNYGSFNLRQDARGNLICEHITLLTYETCARSVYPNTLHTNTTTTNERVNMQIAL